MKTKRKHPEKDLQKTTAAFLDRALPKDAWFTSILGGYGKATIRAAGYKRGAPDIIVLWRGLLIAFELKAESGHLEESQRETRQKILDAGGFWHLCKSVESVALALRSHDMKLRAKVSA